MPTLVSADEYFYHQIPEPHLNVATYHEHWRESFFYILHPRSAPGDVVILTMAHYPKRQIMDSLQMGRINGQPVFAHYSRPYDNDPHTLRVGPVTIDIIEPYKKIKLNADSSSAVVGIDLTFTARTQAYGLRRGTITGLLDSVASIGNFLTSMSYAR